MRRTVRFTHQWNRSHLFGISIELLSFEMQRLCLLMKFNLNRNLIQLNWKNLLKIKKKSTKSEYNLWICGEKIRAYCLLSTPNIWFVILLSWIFSMLSSLFALNMRKQRRNHFAKIEHFLWIQWNTISYALNFHSIIKFASEYSVKRLIF